MSEHHHVVRRLRKWDVTEPPTPSSGHDCKCGQPAVMVDGYYLVGSRRVRVWTCESCHSGLGPREVKPPAHIQAALDQEAEHLARLQKSYRMNVDTERGESVKYMAPTGTGKMYMPSRAESWRWGTTNLSRNSPLGRAAS